jgi:hypothetical protein
MKNAIQTSTAATTPSNTSNHSATRSNPVITLILGATIVAAAAILAGGSGHARTAAATDMAARMESLPRIFAVARTGDARQIREAIKAGELVNAVCPELVDDLPRGSSPIMVAARHGRAETVRQLRRAGALVNARAQNGWTPLHVAAAFGQVDVIDALAEAGGDLEVTATMRGGMTPAQLAEQMGQEAAAAKLRELEMTVQAAISTR